MKWSKCREGEGHLMKEGFGQDSAGHLDSADYLSEGGKVPATLKTGPKTTCRNQRTQGMGVTSWVSGSGAVTCIMIAVLHVIFLLLKETQHILEQ